jgi:hypothetical protein
LLCIEKHYGFPPLAGVANSSRKNNLVSGLEDVIDLEVEDIFPGSSRHIPVACGAFRTATGKQSSSSLLPFLSIYFLIYFRDWIPFYRID